jgi:hypothetical protein
MARPRWLIRRRCCGRLHRPCGRTTGEDSDAAEQLRRPVERSDGLVVEDAGGVGNGADRRPLTVSVAVETAGEDLHDRRRRRRREVLHQEAARGRQVDEAGHVAAELVPVGER